jgi:hypothetical protein
MPSFGSDQLRPSLSLVDLTLHILFAANFAQFLGIVSTHMSYGLYDRGMDAVPRRMP